MLGAVQSAQELWNPECLDNLQFTLNHTLKYLRVNLHIGEVAKDKTHTFHRLLPLAINLEQRENIIIFMVKKKKLNKTLFYQWKVVSSPFFGPQQ